MRNTILPPSVLAAVLSACATESVVLNSERQPVTLSLPVEGYLADGAILRDVWRNGELRVKQGKLEGIHVPARSGTVLESFM